MKLKHVAIATGWIIVLAVPFSQGIEIGHLKPPHGAVAPSPPIKAWFVELLLAFIISAAATRFVIRHPGQLRYFFDWSRYLIERTFGAGAYQEFLVRFRPTALIIVCYIVTGVTGLVSTYSNEQNPTAYFLSAFSLSVGLGMLLAYFFSSRFPWRFY